VWGGRKNNQKYGNSSKEGHKYKECPLWQKQARVVCLVREKAHQQEERKPAHPERGKVQKRGKKREVRRMEEEKAVCPARGEVQQEEWKRSSIEELRKRAEEHCSKRVLQEARLLELGWVTEEVVVLYLTCKCGKNRSHVEDNWGKGVVPLWKWRKLSWYGCKEKIEEKVAHGQGTWKAQPKRGVAKGRLGEPSKC